MTTAIGELLESDRQLVLNARAGNREAFSRLVVRYERPVLAIAFEVLHCWQDARDVGQESFIQAYRSLNQLSAPEKFGPWVLQIARRGAMRLRKQKRRTTTEFDSADLQDTHAPAGSTAIPRELLSVIARLPKSERVIVMLRYVDELSTPEIARVTGRPVGTITKQLSRAHQRLRHWLAKEMRDA